MRFDRHKIRCRKSGGVELRTRRLAVRVFCARIQPPQRICRVDRIRVCGARADTPQYQYKRCSPSSCRSIILEYSYFLWDLGVGRSRVAVHSWVQKPDLQPADGESPGRVAVDHKAVRITTNNTGCRLPSIQRRTKSPAAVSNDDKTDDTMVSGRVASTISA